MRRWLVLGWVVTIALVAVAAGLWLNPGSGAQTESDQSYLARLISNALSTADTRVTIGALDGALSSDATIRNLQISDRDGVWLKLDRARLVWDRGALFSRRLQVDKLEVGHLEILRLPVGGPRKPDDGAGPLLPDPPVKIVVSDFSLAQLVLGEPVLGVASQFSSRGTAQLGNPSEGLTLNFDLARTDQPGRFAVKLAYVPKTQALNFALGLKEEAGGLLSKISHIPGEPPVALDLIGKGKLDDFAADLTFAAGPTIGATGKALLKREGVSRRLTLAMSAQVAGLLPEVGAAIFPGATRLDGDLLVGDDGAVHLPRLALTAETARMDITGDIAADQTVAAQLTLGALPTAIGAVKAAGGEIKSFAMNIAVTGKLSAPQMELIINAEGARLRYGGFDQLQAHLTTAPVPALGAEAATTALRLDAKASGVTPVDPALAKALGGELLISAKGRVKGDGAGVYENIHVATPTADFAYSGALGPTQLLGRLVAQFPNLAAFDAVAGVRLAGKGQIAADLDGSPREARVAARLDGSFHGLATGLAPVDRLTGGEITLNGLVRSLAGGGFGFENLRVTGQHVEALANGVATGDKADVAASINVADLRHADPRLTGKGALEARLTGSLAHPDATARLALSDAAMLGRPVPKLIAQIDARDLTGKLDAKATLDGTLDGKPAKGGLHLARENAGWRLDGLDLAIGSFTAKGAATIAAGLATGQFNLAAKNLDDLSPLLLTRLAGEMNAGLALDADGARQNAKLNLKAAGLKAENSALDQIDANIALTDAYGRASLNADASVSRAFIGGEAISQIRLNARGDSNATDLTASARARGFDLATKARVTAGETIRIDLASLEARGQGRRIALAGPARIALAKGEADISDFALALDAGRLTLNGRAGQNLDLRIAARAIPLALADLAAPGLGLGGTLDGEATLTGAPGKLGGQWRANIARLIAPAARNAGLPPIDISAAGRLQGEATSLDANVAMGKAGNLKVVGNVPLSPTGAIDVGVKGTLDAAIANANLAPAGRRVTGSLLVDLRANGRLPKPQLSGAATMSGGTFSDALQGVQLKDISARLTARGEEIVVEHVSAVTRNGGTLNVSGQLRADAQAGFPGQFRVVGKGAELIASGLVTAIADLALDISGPLAHGPRISGTIGLTSVEVAVPTRLTGAAQPLANVRHLNPPKALAEKLAAQAKVKALAKRGRAPPPFNANLDIKVDAPNRIFVRGRGIDAELGGALRITGATASPLINGGFEMRRGRLAVLGKRLDFTRGNIVFKGDLSPELDFLAEARASDVTVQIGVTGSAAAPQFAFTSDPALPQDEVLSRLLFDKATGNLSPFQALLLAQSVAQFAGGDDGVFERMRRSLGVDSLDIQAGSGGPTVGATRAINDRISVGVKAGATPADNGLSVDVDLTRNVRAKAEVNQEGAASLGIGVEKEY